MAINVQHNIPAFLLSALGRQIGEGQTAREDEVRDDAEAQWQAQLDERQREFNITTAVNQANQWRADRRFAQSAAMAQQARAASFAQRQADNEAALLRQAMQSDAGLERLLLQNQLQMEQDSVNAVDAQLSGAMKDARKMNLTPEGRRLLGQMSGKYAQLRGRWNSLRPEVRADIAGQMLDDLNSMDLASYEVQEPSPDEQFAQSAIPLDGQQIVPGQPLRWGHYQYINGERNGKPTFAERFIPPRTQQEYDEWAAPLPKIPGKYPIPKPDGSADYVDQPKPEKPAADPDHIKPLQLTDYGDLYAEAARQLEAEARSAVNNTDVYTPPTAKQRKERYHELLDALMESGGVTGAGEGEAPAGDADAALRTNNFPTLSGNGSPDEPYQFPPDASDAAMQEVVGKLKRGQFWVAPDGSVREGTQ